MSGEGLRILLVDDNLDHAQLALRALRGEGSILHVRLGAEALARAREERFDLVLLDYRLPDMTGLEVLVGLRSGRHHGGVILMSAQGSEEVAMEALATGADAYLVKNADFGPRLRFEVQAWIDARAQV